MTSHPEQGQDFSKNQSCAGLFYSAAIENNQNLKTGYEN